MTLTEFLLARIAEDEEAASRAGSFTPWTETFQNDNYGHLTIQPARVLADCEAKRRIVEHHADYETLPEDERVAQRVEIRWVVKNLATIYAEHPDYDEAWKP